MGLESVSASARTAGDEGASRAAGAVLRRIAADRAAIDERLASLMDEAAGNAPARLGEAMRYTLGAPGKRLRPLIVLSLVRHLDGPRMAALEAGCAIEMVHAASLILDDLPCMDDAALRRSRPTSHRVFGEATSILASVSLMNASFAVLGRLEGVAERARLSLIAHATEAIGPEGLAGGQEHDLNGRRNGARAPIDDLNGRKTAALFALAARAGAIISGAGAALETRMDAFGCHLGLAFQTLDDLLDAEASPSKAGKDCGQDDEKPTVVRIEGPGAARTAIRGHLDRALQQLDGLDDARAELALVLGGVFKDAA